MLKFIEGHHCNGNQLFIYINLPHYLLIQHFVYPERQVDHKLHLCIVLVNRPIQLAT